MAYGAKKLYHQRIVAADALRHCLNDLQLAEDAKELCKAQRPLDPMLAPVGRNGIIKSDEERLNGRFCGTWRASSALQHFCPESGDQPTRRGVGREGSP
jgi:hypothetical protein